VTFPNSLTTIGVGAFYGATALTSVTFPEGLKSIGPMAFYGAPALTSVTFDGNAPTSVGTSAFSSIGNDPVANVSPAATGFGDAGAIWNGMTVVIRP
jgi:hypothetical protein